MNTNEYAGQKFMYHGQVSSKTNMPDGLGIAITNKNIQGQQYIIEGVFSMNQPKRPYMVTYPKGHTFVNFLSKDNIGYKLKFINDQLNYALMSKDSEY